MQITNIHQRTIARPAAEVAELLLSLATDDDKVWPHEIWMPMKFDAALAVGVPGGHGPIKYTVDHYEPDEKISFRFTSPAWLEGYHQIVLDDAESGCLIRHELYARAGFAKYLIWLFVIRPLHNAVAEDCLTKVERSLGLEPQIITWSWWVKALRKYRGYA